MFHHSEVSLLAGLKSRPHSKFEHLLTVSSRGTSPTSAPDSPPFAPCTSTSAISCKHSTLPAIRLPSLPECFESTLESSTIIPSCQLPRVQFQKTIVQTQPQAQFDHQDDLALLLRAVEKLEEKNSLPETAPPSPTESLAPSSTASSSDISASSVTLSGTKTGRRPYRRNPTNVMKRHKCEWPECVMSFHTTAELVCHTRTHTGERPFGCEVCGKRFAQSGGLLRHRRTHSGEKPYLCEVESCGKAFAESGHLTRHMRSHTGEKPFVCDCGKSFTTSYHLARHKAIHSRD